MTARRRRRPPREKATAPGAPARPRRRLAAAALAAALGAGGAAWWWTRAAPIRRERGLDVLLVTIDTLRVDAVGAYGQARGTTPGLDRLARAGVRFETARAHNTLTLPSHANLLSGRHPYEHGVRDNSSFRFPAGTDTLATLLKAQGYRTGAFVSAVTLDSRFGLDRGFDVYDDGFARGKRGGFQLAERAAPATVARARDWMAAGGPRPWLCWVHVFEPHAPYEPPEPWASSFRDAPYLGEVAAADAALASLFEPLLAEGRAGRTLALVTGDHGESLGEHGERTHGLFAYEATLRVPLVLYAPRLLAPRVVVEPVRHVDLLPTVLDALGLPAPAGLPGRSLLPLAAGRRFPAAPTYFEALSGMLTRGWAPLYGVVSEEWKYVDLPLPELYDLGRDARERTSRAAAEPRRMAGLRGLLGRFRSGEPSIARRTESAELRERLAAVGCLGAASAPLKPRYTEDDDPKRLVHLDDLMQEVVARQRAGDRERALALAREVVRQRPDMASALIQVALLEREAGRLQPALAALERVVASNRDDLSAVALLGSYLSEAGRAEEAAQRLAPYASREDAPEDLLTSLGVALARTGRRQRALAAFERARALDPENAVTLVQIATVHLAAGEGSRARARLEEALRLDPDLALAHHQLGLLALAAGEARAAERHLRAALAREPGQADALLNLARLLAREGREHEARPLFERFLQVAPDSVYARELEQVRARLRRRAPNA